MTIDCHWNCGHFGAISVSYLTCLHVNNSGQSPRELDYSAVQVSRRTIGTFLCDKFLTEKSQDFDYETLLRQVMHRNKLSVVTIPRCEIFVRFL